MSTSSESAQNLFIGLGIALLLASAFALIDGRLPPADCPESTPSQGDPCVASSELAWLIPGTAIICLGIGLTARMARMSGNPTILDRYFSNESEAEMTHRLSEEFVDAHDTDRISGAWANMEVKMLETNHSEEE